MYVCAYIYIYIHTQEKKRKTGAIVRAASGFWDTGAKTRALQHSDNQQLTGMQKKISKKLTHPQCEKNTL